MGARSAFPSATGFAVGLAGIGFVGMGLWGRREVRRALAQERIVAGGNAGRPSEPVVPGAAASLRKVVTASTGPHAEVVWRLGYPFALALMVLVSVGLYIVFKRRRRI